MPSVGEPATAGLALLQDLEPKLIDWGWIGENFGDEILPALIGHMYLSFV